jgi:hypothetical protein
VKLIIYQDDDKRIIGINWVWLFETTPKSGLGAEEALRVEETDAEEAVHTGPADRARLPTGRERGGEVHTGACVPSVW